MTKIHNSQVVYAMDPTNPPVMTVSSGSDVIFETCDCFQNQITSEAQSVDSVDWERINPATGTLYVEGTSPGDVLQVDILDITISDQWVMAATGLPFNKEGWRNSVGC